MAQCGYIHDLLEGNVHPTQSQAYNPDDSTRSLCVKGVALTARADGVNDSQVSVNADASQEKDSAIAVQWQESPRDLANSQTKHPLVGPLHCKQGKSEGQQQIRNGQVKEEGVGQRGSTWPATLRASVAPDHTNDQHVADDSQGEQQTVDHWGVPLCKTVDVFLLAGRYVEDVSGGSEIFIVIKALLLKQGKWCELYSRKKKKEISAFVPLMYRIKALF